MVGVDFFFLLIEREASSLGQTLGCFVLSSHFLTDLVLSGTFLFFFCSFV